MNEKIEELKSELREEEAKSNRNEEEIRALNQQIEELYMIINNNKTPERLFACLLYPSHYFYIVKKMLLGQENTNAQKHVMKYMENTKRYKDFLIFIKKQLKKNREIQLLDWINK